MQPDEIRSLLKKVRAGSCSTEDALAQLAQLPFADLGVAKIDHHRALRCGFAEVIFGPGKTPTDIVRLVETALKGAPCILCTRVDAAQSAALMKRFPQATHNLRGRTVRVGTPAPLDTAARGEALIITAGTSDIPVAEEALETLRAFGCPAKSIYDVGVAGLHRVLKTLPELKRAPAIICVAGMEGALPSVVGGLVACPVIAVPTSVGYGASFGGLAALLSMMNTCASGVSVVNIDNGFGAAMCVLRILRRSLTAPAARPARARRKLSAPR
jgi:pyridinium-3,5-biscarboxylic acid mononucleotide synthase